MSLKSESEVLVVGAGPVGLLAALSLSDRGMSVQIIDKEWRGAVHSYALALHASTLDLLGRYGLAEELIGMGRAIESLALYEGADRLAAIDLTTARGLHPFVLVLPQSTIEHALERKLRERGIEVAWNHQCLSIDERAGEMHSRVARMDKFSMGYPIARSEWMVTKETDVRSKFLIGADGYHSTVRNSLATRFEHRGEAQAFSVFEFEGSPGSDREVRIGFHEGSTNVLWPLDRDRGRFSFEVEAGADPALDLRSLEALVLRRAPWFDGTVSEVVWSTTALFERRLVDRFGRGRTWLVGDAAHVTGPVGAQSMNVGLREAHELGGCLWDILKAKSTLASLEKFESERQTEWQRLLGLGPALLPRADAPSRVAEHAGRILPCLPASGDDLERFAAHLELRFD